MFRLIRRFRRDLKHSILDWAAYLRWRYFEFNAAIIDWFRTTSELTVDQSSDDAASVKRGKIRFSSLINPLFWIKDFWGFLMRFLASRNPVSFLLSLPAALCAVAPFAILHWKVPTSSDLLQKAQAGYQQTVAADNLEAAEFYLKLWQSLSEDPVPPRLAECDFFQRTGRLDRALALAEDGYRQFAAMSLLNWLVNQEFQQFIKLPDDVATDAATSTTLESHLKYFLEQQPTNAEKGMMLGTLYVRRGNLSSAAEILTEVVGYSGKTYPEAPYYLAICQQQLGHIPEAVTAAQLAAEAFQEELAKKSFTFRLLFNYCRSLVIAQREGNALQVMDEHMSYCTPDEKLQLVFLKGDVYATWSKRLRQNSDRNAADFFTSIELLGRGLAIAPQNPRLLEELTVVGCSKDVDADLLEQKLTQAIDSGVSPGLVHFIQGTRDLLRDPPAVESALSHFQLAEQHNQSYPGILNNLAHAMAISETGDMKVAFDLVEQALRMMPNEPVIYETRGRILLRMKEPAKAIADFEKALANESLRGDAHEGLAKAFEMQGKDGESTRHAQMAADFRKKSPPEN